MSQDMFDSVVDEEDDDLNLSTSLHGSFPLAMSGVSSESQGGSSVHLTPSEETPVIFSCDGCKKSFKTKKGFENHTILIHKLPKFNLAQSEIFISAVMEDLVVEALTEIKEESDVVDGITTLCKEVLDGFKSENSVHFLQALSEMFVNTLSTNSKLLPTNQFEEFLCSFNKSLNNTSLFDQLKKQLLCIVTSGSHEEKAVGMVLFRLTSKVAESLFFHFARQCRESDTVIESQMLTVEEHEKLAFKSHSNKLFQSYFKKVSKLTGDVWKCRCLCMRQKFVISDVLDSVSTNDIIAANAFSDDGNIYLSCEAFDCFLGIELCIRSLFAQKKTVSVETVMKELMQCDKILNTWSCLTSEHLSDYDSLVFLKDFASIFTALSIRLEGDRLHRVEEKKQQLQKVSVRTNLKRN